MRRANLHLSWLIIGLVVALAAAAAAAQREASSSSSSSTTSVSSSSATSVVRLRANKLRRPESCREHLPRKSEDLPALVITGRVKEVYLAGVEPNTGANFGLSALLEGGQPVAAGAAAGNTNRALVTIGRVIKGNEQLLGSDIIVSGFNSSNSQPCPNYVKPNDTLIFLLNQEADRKYSIQGSNLLNMNLNNLDRINAIAADEPYKRRPPIEDILCEAHYCPFGRCVASDRGQLRCDCPESCPPVPQPVCGSDNATYTNECHLIKEGCRRQRPLFVTKESSC